MEAHFGRYRDFGLYTDSLAFCECSTASRMLPSVMSASRGASNGSVALVTAHDVSAHMRTLTNAQNSTGNLLGSLLYLLIQRPLKRSR